MLVRPGTHGAEYENMGREFLLAIFNDQDINAILQTPLLEIQLMTIDFSGDISKMKMIPSDLVIGCL